VHHLDAKVGGSFRMSFRNFTTGKSHRAACDCQILACEEIPPALVVGAAAEAANQVSYTESNGGSRVRALLYGCTEEVLSPAGAFANSFHGIRRRLLHLSVDILRCTFHLFCLALELTSPVARPSPSSTWPPTFLALPITRSSFMSVVLLKFRISTVGMEVGFPFPAQNQTENINGL
jgi:hypothetical protein